MSDETIAKSRRIFRADIRDHVMTVLHDDGLYRHLRCARPDTGCYTFDIVTWPGHLSIGGAYSEGYVFARTADMFEFFAHDGDINPGYWGEKVVTGSTPHPELEFSPEVFKAAVVDEFMRVRHDFPGESAELFRRIREYVIEAGGEHVESALEALRDFKFHSRLSPYGREFEFGDWWEMNLTDWSWHFLRACHAIVWGIAEYRRVKAEAVNVYA